MAEGIDCKNRRQLCTAELEAKDPGAPQQQILQELNKVFKHEEQVRRDFRSQEGKT
jgi:hypothetical protein